MAALQRELRQSLERTIVLARAAAETAGRSAIATLAVNADKPYPQMSEDERRLRRGLRAKSRQLGGDDALVAEIAYQHWHRMLFARFLAENGLLIYPESKVAVTFQEVAELAKAEGEADPWMVASRFAAAMLPAIFRSNDPTLEIRLAPEGRQRLEALLSSLPKQVFTADDSLGWVYQFWQSEKKRDINNAGGKIGAADLPAVTQIFTENYMVRFLLENSLGAWWAARHPRSRLQERFHYLRLTEDGNPAAGSFEAWPSTAAEVTVMDPCCGSGHFLTVAFEMLVAMRMEQENLSLSDAGDAVIRGNIFGLEIDARCTQIAAFALAMAAWRLGGYRQLPPSNIACSGVGVSGQPADWKNIAQGDKRVEEALLALHELFAKAPELGSLIDPRSASSEGHLFSVDYEQIAPLLEKLLSREVDAETRITGWAAAGIARAAALLAGKYTLLATNVPYLARGRQSETLTKYCDARFPEAKLDLATCFIDRCLSMGKSGDSLAVVGPEKWLFLGGYRRFRTRILKSRSLLVIAGLGPQAFSTPMFDLNVVLVILSNSVPHKDSSTVTLDVSSRQSGGDKERALHETELTTQVQLGFLKRPDARVTFARLEGGALLNEFAQSAQGICTGDYAQFGRCFWELPRVAEGWELQQSTVSETQPWGGREHVLLWEGGCGRLLQAIRRRLGEGREGSWIRGTEFLGKRGVVISQSGALRATLFEGNLLDNNAAVIVPNDPSMLTALWAYCRAPQFNSAVREIDRALKVTNLTLLKVPFDLEHWQGVANKLYPNGLPEVHSNDPTQWLFEGDPTSSLHALQVATARLLGYHWLDHRIDTIDGLADSDGAVCIPAVGGEPPAADRLRVLLETAWGHKFSPDLVHDLVAKEGVAGKDLETWLRDDFFGRHTKLFHNRPFIWQIWDGRRDGFSALVNYHRLDHKLLERITYTLLGAWIELQTDHVGRGVPGAENRLAAAQKLQRKLELIAEGEPPHDIYVRWKLLADQPIGWDPDLNDGVRINIRPFVEAGVLRTKLSINWSKDRGSNPDGSERINDLHFTRAQKEAARLNDRRRPA
jgi:hypothetical protein